MAAYDAISPGAFSSGKAISSRSECSGFLNRSGYQEHTNTFWTECPFCRKKLKFYRDILDRLINCYMCRKAFEAQELKKGDHSKSLNSAPSPITKEGKAISSRSECSGLYTPQPIAHSNQPVIHEFEDLLRDLHKVPVDLMAMYKRPMDCGAVSTDKKPFVPAPCNRCSRIHLRYSDCPYSQPCNICYITHDPYHCPYTKHFPRGAPFNRASYEIFCACGNVFNEDKWICTSCRGRYAALYPKYCSICRIKFKHSSRECPKDRVCAAEFKSIRDKLLLRATAEPKTASFEVYVPQRRKSYSSDEDDFP